MADFTQDVGGILNLNRSTLTDGLVGWWPLSQANYQGGVFVDESGNGNDGTPANVPNFGIDNFRNPTGATVFNGSSDYVNCGNPNVLKFLTDMTISLWVRERVGSGIMNIVLDKRTTTNSGSYSMQIYINDAAYGYWFVNDYQYHIHTSAYIPRDKQWHHVLCTISESGGTFTNTVYVDGMGGVPRSSTGDYSTTNTGNLEIGKWEGYFFSGSLFDVRIYNRALSPAEIKLLYTPSLTMGLELDRVFSGGITPAGALDTLLSAYRSFGGGITPVGNLIPIPTYIQALFGELTPTGELSARNPLWLLIDETLRWMGEWSATYAYDIDDVVLHQTTDANEWHVFISKAGHNTGNTPTSSAAWWRRLYQEPLS